MPTQPGDDAATADPSLAAGLAFEHAVDAMVLARDDGTILHWNAAAGRLLRITEAEARRRNVTDVFDATRIRIALRGLEFGARGRPVELTARRGDGGSVWVEVSLSRFLHQGKPYLLLVGRDVSRRIRGREDDAARIRQLEDAVASLEAFTYVVGHDLKEPVRAMGTYLEEALESADPAERVAYARRAMEAHRNLEQLLRGLLEWSRTAMTPLEPEPLRVQDVLKDPGCAAQFGSLVAERNARLEVAPDMPPVLATESLLCRLFGNLVTNAVRHNPRPRPLVRIRSGEPLERNEVRILVEDDGPGLPEAVRDRFAKLPNKPVTLKGGFGLAITRRAAERLNGRLGVEERPGGGTRFIVDLPAAVQATDLETRVRELV